MRKLRRLGMVGAILTILAGWATLSAQAYAVPVQSSPDEGSVVRKSPAYVSITFNTALDPFASQIEVFDVDGNKVDRNDCGIDVADPSRKTMISTLKPDLEPGVYTVRWTTVTNDGQEDDGYVVQGQFQFTLAPSILHIGLTVLAGLGVFLVVTGGWVGFGLTYRRLRRLEERLAGLE
ncbi:MAG: copper resistance protein CopC [Ardenticatenaceae bacterium]|nr:copper resistance protein CopC [Ardenticatenaceae bacterium]MCB9443875.1 copper resistance protein CopC [Ardenticatenaceae bacterium]